MKRRILALTVTILLLSSSGWAFFVDPYTTSILLGIARWLNGIAVTVHNIAGTAEDIRTHLHRIWPDNVIRPIQTYIEPVLSVKRDLERMSCAWRISPRLQLLHRGLFNGGKFCKPEFQAVFGAPVPGPFEDIEEYEDMNAVDTLRDVGDFTTKSDRWAEETRWLTHETLGGVPWGIDPADDPLNKFSVGYSQRLAALGAAQVGNLMVEEGKLTAKELRREQIRINRKWYEHRLRETWALMVYGALGHNRAPIFNEGPEGGVGPR